MNCLICLVNEQLVSSCTQLVHYYITAIWDLGWVRCSKMKKKMKFGKPQSLKNSMKCFWLELFWRGLYQVKISYFKMFSPFHIYKYLLSNFYPHFGALWDECSDVDSRRHQSRGPQQAASTRLKSGVVKPFDLNSSFS